MKRFFCVLAIVVINFTPIRPADPEILTLTSSIDSQPNPFNSTDPLMEPEGAIKPGPSNGCNCSNKVRLYRLYSLRRDDHFYTTSLQEANNAANTLGYRHEGTSGWVFPSTANCVCNEQNIPIYRLFITAGKKSDHFYTASLDEAISAVQKLKYKYEGIAFYCSAKQGDCSDCGPKAAFHRFNRHIDHFYTTSVAEAFANVVPYGGTYEKVLCYIWSSP